MSSNVRQQLNNWIANIEVKGSVIDIGGLRLPSKGRTKTWDVTDYKILDIQHGYRGYKTDYVKDLNVPIVDVPEFDNAFCLEVLNHIYDPIIAFHNINRMLKKGGYLYISTHFLFPHSGGGSGRDCLRYTRDGLNKLLSVCGFEIVNITPRYARSDKLLEWCNEESKIVRYKREIGYLIKARKC